MLGDVRVATPHIQCHLTHAATRHLLCIDVVRFFSLLLLLISFSIFCQGGNGHPGVHIGFITEGL